MTTLGQEPIYLYDLQYTLKIDTINPAHLKIAWDHYHTVAALQGIVNRDAPRLYLRFTNHQHRKQNIDQFWLEKLKQPAHWLANRPVVEIADLHTLIQKFLLLLRVVVLYDSNVAATSHVASTIAGVENLKELLLSAYRHGVKQHMIHIGGFVPWAYKYTVDHPEASDKHKGVSSEWEYGKIISAYNG